MIAILAGFALLATEERPWTLLLSGDVMLNGVAVSSRPFKGIASLVRSSDIALTNLEIPLTTATTPTNRKSAEELRRRDQFVLKAAPGHIKSLAGAGFDAVSLGNNHAMDYGDAGLSQMLDLLDGVGVKHAGAGQNADDAMRPASLIAPDGSSVAVLSALAYLGAGALRKCTPATDATAGIAVLSFGGVIDEKAKKKLSSWIGAAKRDHSFVVVALHWGIERETVPSRYQVALGRAVMAAGADVVWGHHPHVMQGMEYVDGKPIFYSLGNLVSPLGGEAGFYRLTINGGKTTGVEYVPGRIARGRVSLLTEKKAAAATTAQTRRNALLAKRYPQKTQ